MSSNIVNDGNQLDNCFVRHNILTEILPNFSEINDHANASLEEIKRIFIYCVEEEQYYDKFNYGLKLLKSYVNYYSLRLTEHDFVWIVKLLYNILLIKEVDVAIISNTISLLGQLLRAGKLHISRSSLELNWRSLYDIWIYYNTRALVTNGMVKTKKAITEPLSELILLCSDYFPVNSTEEVWNSICSFLYQPYPYNIHKYNGLAILRKFLPMYYNNYGPFIKFVWPNIIQLFDCPTFINSFESEFMQLLTSCAQTYVGLIDWTPYLDRLFTGVLRNLNVKIAGVTRKCKFLPTKLYVNILIHAIYGSDNCIVIDKFKQLFQAISHLYHPSASEVQSPKLIGFLYYMASSILNRYRNELKHKRPHESKGFYTEEYFLSDSHIKQLVEIVLPSSLSAIFTKNRTDFSIVLQSVQDMANLCPQIVIPQCLQLLHDTATSAESVLQPHRTLSILTVISLIHVPMLNSPDQYPEGKLAVFPLMRLLIACINVNDLPKSNIALICFGNLVSMLYIEDMSDKAIEEGLTPFEREVASATAQFEDLILQFFDRVFEMIEIAYSDYGMVETHKSNDYGTQSLIDTMLMVIPSLGEGITRQLLDKTLEFVFSHSLQNRYVQIFISMTFSCIVDRSDEILLYAYSKFFPRYCNYFKECLQDDCIVLGENIDAKFSWLTYIMSGLLQPNHLDSIKDDLFLVLDSLDKIRTSPAIRLFNSIISRILSSCCKIYIKMKPKNYLKQTDFYRNSWRGLVDKVSIKQLYDLGKFKMEYDHPGEIQLSIIKQLITRYIRPAIEVVNKFTQLTRIPNNTTKLERLEFTFAYHKISKVTSYMAEEKIVDINTSVFEFDPETSGPIEPINYKDFLQFNYSIKHQSKSMWIELSNDLRRVSLDALKAVTEFINQSENDISNLPIIITEFHAFFNLLSKSYELHTGTKSINDISAFLNRRFAAFIDFRMKKCNTPFNWRLTFDKLFHDTLRHHKYVLTNEIIEVTKLLLQLVCCSNITIQESSLFVISNLCQNYLQLHEFVINNCLEIVQQKLASSDGIDENSHNGIAQLLLKIFKTYPFASESMNFYYKLVVIFISLCKNQLTEHRSNKNYTNKMFKHLIDVYSFKVKNFTINKEEFFKISENLRQTTVTHTDQLQSLLPQLTNRNWILEERRKLYYSCIENGLSVFLQNNTQRVETANVFSGVKELFTDALINRTLKPTTTWTSTLQMSIVLPLHHELEISTKILEMYLLTLFSPSKELSSHACNQICLIVWLLRGKKLPCYMSRDDISNQSDVTLQSFSLTSAGPRDDNHWLVIDKNTDYWALLPYARPANMIYGFLGWPESVKIRPDSDTIDIENCQKKSENCDNFSGDNVACWELLTNVFKSDIFHEQLRNFLINLASHFLRVNDMRSSGATANQNGHMKSNEYASFGLTTKEGKSILSLYAVSTFYIEDLVQSILMCIGPEEGLEKVIETYNVLIKFEGQHKMYVHKVASKVVFGMIVGMKYWKKETQQKFFNHQLPLLMDTHFQFACKSELNSFPHVIYDICSSTNYLDLRKLIPLYRYAFDRLIVKHEHESNKQAACLFFINCFVKLCSWRIGPSIAIDMIQLWYTFINNSVDKVRREAGKLMRIFFLFENLSNDHYFQKYCNDIDETSLIRLSQFYNKVKHLLALHTNSILTEKELKASKVTHSALVGISLEDKGCSPMSDIEEIIGNLNKQTINKDGDINAVKNLQEDVEEDDEDEEFVSSSTSSQISILDVDNKCTSQPESPMINAKPIEVIATTASSQRDTFEPISETEIKDRVLATICSFISKLMHKDGNCIEKRYLDLFQVGLDLIPVRNKMSLYQHLRQWVFHVSSLIMCTHTESLTFDNSSTELQGRWGMHPQSVINLVTTCGKHHSWRVRVVILKMMQFLSFYNLFVISREPYLSLWMGLVFDLLADSQIEVRKEASNLFSGLIQLGIYRVESKFIQDMKKKIVAFTSETSSAISASNSLKLIEAHTGVLSLAAFIQAHPFDIPLHLPEALYVLCSASNKPEPIATTVRMILASFKKNHQESWHLERHHFTEDQLCALRDVLVSPSYYA